MEVRPGQQWRDLRSPRRGAQIVSVDSVDGATVRGSYAAESLPTTRGDGTWRIEEFDEMTLVCDPECPVHRVVLELPGLLRPPTDGGPAELPRVDDALRHVGVPADAGSLQPAADRAVRSIVCWDVVAPSEADAVRRVREALHRRGTTVDLHSIYVGNAGLRVR